MRIDETLKLLRKRGGTGVSSEDIATKFGFKRKGSASKLINQLRAQGHYIKYNKKDGVYILYTRKHEQAPPSAPKVHLEDIVTDNEIPAEDNNTKASDDALFFRVAGKKDKVLELLLREAPKRVSGIVLAKYAGVMPKNISPHIYALRHTDGHKIISERGYYSIKGNKKNKNYGKGIDNLTPSHLSVEVASLLGDKRLISDIHKLNPGELPTYMDFLKKIIFFTKCALAMYETDSMLETITIGDFK